MARVYKNYTKLIPLFNDAYYTVDITLEGNPFKMTFIWNERIERYCANLKKTDGTVVFEGVVFNQQTMLPMLSTMKQNGLNGYFLLAPFSENIGDDIETNRRWADYFFLVYSVGVEQ